MPRIVGTKNMTNYKYMVEELSADKVVATKYFRTQPEIQKHYDLNRSAVYFLVNNKPGRKTKDNINVFKLEKPLPVYNLETRYVNRDVIKSYRQIEY